jgi:8-oxo-dGTP diphosphatase
MNQPATGPSNSTPPQSAPTYYNPIPVVVALVPVRISTASSQGRNLGLLTIERGIEPQKGQLALPGGFLEYEDWRVGLLRELCEETGLKGYIITQVKLLNVHSVAYNTRLALFASLPVVDESELASCFAPTEECPRYQIITAPHELAFSTHTEMARRFFEVQADEVTLGYETLSLPTRPEE